MANTSRFSIPLNVNTLTEDEIGAAKQVLDSGFLTMGRKCREFENEFAKYLGVKHAVMVNSGSSANLLVAFALFDPLCPLKNGRRRLARGAEVIVPALTWPTTIWPFVQAGAVPVFVDCDPETLQMRPEDIEAAITPRTAAITIVHVLGGAVDMTAVCNIANAHKLWLFEDTCESLGVLWNGRQVGSFGHLASFSFYFSHHITTIEGGMLVTDDAVLADLLRALRAHGWVRQMDNPDPYAVANPQIDPRFLFITTGFNLRPTEINAAIGLIQLPKLDGFNKSRRRIGRRLNHGLASLTRGGHLISMNFDQRCTPAPFGFPILCRSTEERNGLREHLEKSGIETRPVICGNLVRQPAMRNIEHRVSGSLSGADRVMDCGLYWGTHPLMSEGDVNYIVERAEEYWS